MYGRVKIVPICAGGQIPSEDVLADVLAACSADDVRPLTDMVTVEAPETHEYDIELTYYTTKANESEVVQNVEGSGGAIDQYINWQGSTLNQDINPDELRKRILCPDWADDLIGATCVQIIKPEYTELNSTTVAKFSGKKTVKHMATFPTLDSIACTINASRLIDTYGEQAAYQQRTINKVAGQGTMIKITIPIYEVTA